MPSSTQNRHDRDDPNEIHQCPASKVEPVNAVALGVFVKEPIPGTVKTRLGAEIGLDESAHLYEQFVNDLVGRFRKLPQRLIMGYSPDTVSAKNWVGGLFSGDQAVSGGNETGSTGGLEGITEKVDLWSQPSGGLGERIIAFFYHAFSDPDVESVVLIGSDSPTIPREYLLRAFEWLRHEDCVVGPSSDGGYYLIGLRRPCDELFQEVVWSESSVLSQTIEKIQQAGLSLKLLPVWYDIDSRDDLEMLKGHLSGLLLSGEEDVALRTHQWLSNWELVSSK